MSIGTGPVMLFNPGYWLGSQLPFGFDVDCDK